MLISIVVPIYKVEKYIHRCVDSILAQTFTDFELILVDDGSPDNCGIICDEYALKDNRIHVIHKENGGLSDARNAGIDWAFENSNSEWLTFIDSDDWVHPRYLEALYNAVVESGCSISACGYQETTGEEPNVDENQLSSKIVNTEQFFCEHTVNATVAWGKLYKKSFFVTIRYPVNKLHEDEFTTYKILFVNKNCAYIYQPLYYYFQNEEGIMKSAWSIKKLVVLDAYEGQLEFFRKHRYQNAKLCTAKNFLWYLREYYFILLDLNGFDKKEEYIKRIRKDMRRCLSQKGIKKPIAKNKVLYRIGYPKLMKLYRFKNRVKKKIQQLI